MRRKLVSVLAAGVLAGTGLMTAAPMAAAAASPAATASASGVAGQAAAASVVQCTYKVKKANHTIRKTPKGTGLGQARKGSTSIAVSTARAIGFGPTGWTAPASGGQTAGCTRTR